MTPASSSERSGQGRGRIERVALERLALDWQNPRLPDHMQRADVPTAELMLYIDKAYEPIDIARSIARHGYFESEPLIGVEEDGNVTVVEGNRRLVALRGLLDTEARGLLERQTRAWRALPTPDEMASSLPDDLPVVMVASRQEIAPLLGYRHISGIAPWEPFAQARYIYKLVDEESLSFEEVSELVGRDLTEVRSMYRDHEILRQAESEFDLDVKRAQSNFGVLNRAMTTRNIRAYIGAPAPAEVSAEFWPLNEDSAASLKRLLTWIFGDKGGRGAAISDSRQLSSLGRVLADEAAEQVLRRTGSLESALDAIGDPGDRFRKHVQRARDQLKAALENAPDDLDSASRQLLDECRQAFDAIDEVFGARRAT
jgi:hypothetical protein